MNTGHIVTRGLNQANLSVADILFRDYATDILNEIVQEFWMMEKWKFRKASFTISTTSGTSEYTLNKRVMINDIIQNSMRGSSPIRRIKYRPTAEHNRLVFSSDSGDPYWYREGTLQGFQTNPSSASTISFVSSLTNYTTGTVTIPNGSRRMVFTNSTITLDMIGRWIRIGSDTKAFRIVQRDYGSSSIFYLNEAYDGVSKINETFVIGDVNQKVSVLGIVSSQLTEEEVQLNGASAAVTTKSFSSIVRISKDKTYGYVTGTSNSGAVTNIVLDPGETEADFQTVLFYPAPDATETLNYDAYQRHPILYKPTDSPLFPGQYHPLLVTELYIRLMEDWNKKGVGAETLRRRDQLLQDMVSQNNNTDNWQILQESEESSERSNLDNLPATYGYQDE